MKKLKQKPIIPDVKTCHPKCVSIFQLSPNPDGKNNLARIPDLDLTAISPKGNKVTRKEGVKLVAKGFVSKFGEMFKSIVKHPIKTIGAIALTTVGLTALPIIGISSVTGAAALALVYGAFTVRKTFKDLKKAIKDNKDNNYNTLRKDLKNIGGDVFHLVLSLPLVPKAIQQIRNQFKGEMGLKVAHELEFIKLPTFFRNMYLYLSGKLAINSRKLNPFSLPYYVKNIMEVEAFNAQKQVTRLHPNLYTAITQGIAKISDDTEPK